MERKDDVLNCWPRHWSFSLAFPGKPRLQEEAGVSGTSLTTALSWTRGPGRGFFPGCLGFKSHTTLPWEPAGAGAGAGVVPRVTYIIGTPGTGRHEGRGLPCENLVAIGPRRDGEGTPCHTSRVTTWKGQGEGLGKGATGAAAGSRAVRSNAGIVRGGEYLHPSDAVR